MKKKVITMALALTLALSMTGTAFAETTVTDTSDPKTGNTVVDYTVAEGYTVTIPDNKTLTDDDGDGTFDGNGILKASDVRIASGKTLKVEISSTNFDNGYNLVYDTNSKIPYTIKVGSDEITENNKEVYTVQSGATPEEVTLSYEATATQISNASKAGNHTDTLTFTVDVTDTETNE
jgi:hypothetical protein